jgi:hypothetical protein
MTQSGPTDRAPRIYGGACQDRKGWLNASIGGTPHAFALPPVSANVHQTPRAVEQRSRILPVRLYLCEGEENRSLLHESMPEAMACGWMPS